MANVPTDLLRTFVALVDLRSFTRVAQAMHVTQPAVSAQIRRLQELVGHALLDKSTPGVALTPRGEVFIQHARRLLALNDQLIALVSDREASTRLRMGVTTDYGEGAVLAAVAGFNASHAPLDLSISASDSDSLLRGLHNGDYDIVVAASDEKPKDAFHFWVEPLAWAAAPSLQPAPNAPVPLVVLYEHCMVRRMVIAAFEEAGRDYKIAYAAGSFAGMMQAAGAGLGVTSWARRSLLQNELKLLDSAAALPKIPDVFGGVYLRAGLENKDVPILADMIAGALATKPAEAA